MRQFVITLVALLSFVPETRAQSFMQHLQQDVKGKGTVTVTQSKDIDELVDKADVSGHKTATAKPAQPGKNNMDVSEPSSMNSYGDNDKY